MQVLEHLPQESPADVGLDIALFAAIEWVHQNVLSNFAARPNINRSILIQYCFWIPLCATLHHTPFALIGLCVIAVLWRFLAACLTTLNYRASKNVRYTLEPETRQFQGNARRQAAFEGPVYMHSRPSDHQYLHSSSPLPKVSRRAAHGSWQWASPSKSTRPLGRSPVRGSDISPGYVSKPTSTQSQISSLTAIRATSPTSKKPARPLSRLSYMLFLQRWNERKKPENTISQLDRIHLPVTPSPSYTHILDYIPSTHLSSTRGSDISPGYVPELTSTQSQKPSLTTTRAASPTKPQVTSQPATNDTVSQLSSGHHPVTHSSSYTPSTGHTPSIRYARTRGSDTSHTSVLPTTSTKSQMPRVTTTKATSPSPVLDYTPFTRYSPTRGSDTSTQSRIPSLTTTRATSPTKPKDTSQPATSDTVSQLISSRHHPVTHSSSYTPSTGRTPSIHDARTRGSDTSHTNVLPTTSAKSQMPRVTTTKATSPTNKQPTWSSRHTPPIRPRVTIKEPKTQASRRDRRPNTSVEINQPPGIPNVGNTCFINAGIQCLNWSGRFFELIERAPPDDKGLIDALVTTMRQCRDRNMNLVDPWPLLRALALWIPDLVTIFKGYQKQQDNFELVGYILNAIDEQYKSSQEKSEEYQRNKKNRLTELYKEQRKVFSPTTGSTTNIFSTCKDKIIRSLQIKRECLSLDHSPVDNLCKGSNVCVRVCQGCFTAHIDTMRYLFFILQLPSSVDDDVIIPLTDFFLIFTQQAVQDEQRCSYCNEDFPAKVYTLMSEPLPQNLIIRLPIEVEDKASGRPRKRQASIAFPVAGLDLNPFLVETRIYEPGTHTPAPLYDLSAFCVHTGSDNLQSGHYIAYCKLSPSDQWYCFDDHHVRPVDIREIGSKDVRLNAFILYYSKRV